jgi:RNA polymerase sigma-70 factor (ECF subfamily)
VEDREIDREIAGLRPAVRAVVRCVLGAPANDFDIDDCASEAFRRAIEHRDRLEDGLPVRPWVLAIARNVALDARRARRRALARSGSGSARANLGSDAGVATDDDQSSLDLIADVSPGPDRRLEIAERGKRLRAALQALPEEQRRAVLLHAEGYGYRDIGERLSAPLGTICTWISRARQGLARALKDDRR